MAAENVLLLDRSLTLPALNTAADNFSHVLSDGSCDSQIFFTRSEGRPGASPHFSVDIRQFLISGAVKVELPRAISRFGT